MQKGQDCSLSKWRFLLAGADGFYCRMRAVLTIICNDLIERRKAVNVQKRSRTAELPGKKKDIFC